MHKPLVAALPAALFLLASPRAETAGNTVRLKEERISLEFTAGADEVTLVVSAEGETGLDRVEIRNPLGAPVAGLASAGGGRSLGLFGFRIEVGESDRETFFATYPEGDYAIRARTQDGRTALGSARLSHGVPRAPIPVYPEENEVDVPASGLTVSWVPDPAAARYEVNLELGETDLLAVRLAPGTGSFSVPDGVLEPGRRYKLEIGAVGADGNCTFREIPFLTR
jgi:hypothetical protein